MAEAGDAIVAALMPSTRRQAISWTGSIAEVARILSDLPAEWTPKTGTAEEKRRYTNARRGFEGDRVKRALPAPAKVAVSRWKIARIRRRGARARIMVDFKISETIDTAIMPSAGKGQYMSTPRVKAFTKPFKAGDFAGAEGKFIAEFLEAYSFEFAEVEEADDIHWIKIWADGDDEPPLEEE